MPAFAFVGPSYEAANPMQDAQRLVNWYVEVDPTSDAKAAIGLLGTPGLSAAVTSAYTGEVRGAWDFAGGTKALWAIGSTIVLMTIATEATATAAATFNLATVGTIATSSGQVCIRDNGAGGIVLIVDGANGYVYNIAAGTLTKITDPGFLGADRIAFIDGIFILNRPGTQTFYTLPIYWNGTSAIDATFFALKDNSTDNLVTLIENKRELWLIGARTSEVWVGSVSVGFQFARLAGAALQIGCSAAHTICRTGSGLMWLGRSERGENLVIQTQDYQHTQVSTPAVAYAIAQYPVIDDAIAYLYTEEGHEFYVLTFPSAGVTWVYDLTTALWHQRAKFDTVTGQFGRHRSNCYLSFAGQRLVGGFDDGQIYRMSRHTYVDGPGPLVSVRRTPHVWDKGDRNRVAQSRLQVEFKPGVGLVTGQGSDPQIMLRWSNDGGFTWGNTHLLGIGKIGETGRRAIKRRLGAARDRVYEVTISDPVNRDVVGATLRGEATDS